VTRPKRKRRTPKRKVVSSEFVSDSSSSSSASSDSEDSSSDRERIPTPTPQSNSSNSVPLKKRKYSFSSDEEEPSIERPITPTYTPIPVGPTQTQLLQYIPTPIENSYIPTPIENSSITVTVPSDNIIPIQTGPIAAEYTVLVQNTLNDPQDEEVDYEPMEFSHEEEASSEQSEQNSEESLVLVDPKINQEIENAIKSVEL